MSFKIAEFVTTSGYVGKIKYAPGTFGSLLAFPLCYIIMYFIQKYKIVFNITDFPLNQELVVSFIIIGLIVCFLLFLIGTYYTSIYIKHKQSSDPKEVVIDEVVGQMLTCILVCFSHEFVFYSSISENFDQFYISFFLLFLLPFGLFRFFDIIKPWPISFCDEKIKGAFGVMIDDVVAGLFAAIVQYVIVYLILDFV